MPILDKELAPGTVVKIVDGYRAESEKAETRMVRMERSLYNKQILNSEQDFTSKIDGQSRECLPKLAVAREQFAAFVKRGLVQLGDWFTTDLPQQPIITPDDARKLLIEYLGSHFTTLISDAVKQGLVESLVIIKVRPVKGKTVQSGFAPLELSFELIRTEDYFLDPTGRRLYEIHTSYLDLHEVQQLADDGVFVRDVVDELTASVIVTSKGKRSEKEAQYRKLVRIDEFWGTLIDTQGRLLARDVMCAVANQKYLVRPVEDNPYWHGVSPFVVAPLLREPHAVWPRAAYDDSASLNAALNELFNLVLDGGIAAVWGVRELRLGALDDPTQVQGGVPQGETLVIREDWPANVPAFTVNRTGVTPQDAVGVFNLLDKEFQSASFTNDIKLGQLPSKSVKATEVIEAQQNSAMTLDSIVNDLESELIRPVLWRAWALLMQHAHELSAWRVSNAIGQNSAARLGMADETMRRQLLVENSAFKVNGISGLISRAREFQRLLPMLQFIFTNPLLATVFVQKYDPAKLTDHLLRLGNVNLDSVKREEQPSMASGAPGATVQPGMPGTPGPGMPGMGMGVPGMSSGSPPSMPLPPMTGPRELQ